MSTSIPLPLLTVEDALSRVVTWLRNPNRDPYATARDPLAAVLDLRKLLDALASDAAGRYRAAHQTSGMTSYLLDIDTNAGPFHTAVGELCR